MKKLLLCAAITFAVYSCSSGTGEAGSESVDTTSPASGANDMGKDGTGTTGMGTGTDTTGLDVGAVQPVDSGANNGNQ